MAIKETCPFCGTKYDPGERYLAHRPERCELRELRQLIDDLVSAWPHDNDGTLRITGRAIIDGSTLDAIAARARDLKLRR